MKRIAFLAVIICLSFFSLLLVGCAGEKKHKYLIGISQLGEADEWRKDMKVNIERELVFYPEISAIYKQADYNSELQVQQIKDFIDKGVDLIIVSPYEAGPLTPVISEAFQKGIKVIIVDRNISSESYNTYISANNYEVGFLAGKYAAHYLGGSGKVAEITGLETSTPAKERERGFAEALQKFPGVQLKKVFKGDWRERSVDSVLATSLPDLADVKLIFAHNDVMAKTAASLLKNAGMGHIKIMGVDALPNTGLPLVENRTLLASVFYPNGGNEAVRLAYRLLTNQNVDRKNMLNTFVVDSTNVVMLKQQNDKIASQQQNIVEQENLLTEQKRVFRTQQNLLFTLLTLFVAVLVALIFLFYLRKKNIRANQKLQLQNEEIIAQSEQIGRMADRARKVNEEKLNFFTNITHELKTPLSLILAPTEDSLQNPRLTPNIKNNFLLIRKNATRLSLLVNQLMDFRQIELNKMSLQLQEVDLVIFVNDVITAFSGLAKQHHITCQLITKENKLKAWVDPEKIEKVLFNILSNAFKFTGDYGFIYITLSRDQKKELAVIEIKDSGRGMAQEEQSHLFEMFYHGSHDGNKGTGIGLALSKEFIDLHKGSITVESEKEKGSVFIIKLRLDKTIFPSEYFKSKINYDSQITEWINDSNLAGIKKPLHTNKADDEVNVHKKKDHSVLIIEDNDDMRDFLSQRLYADFEILTAQDGSEGMKKTFELMPDLIISDIIMPKTSGIELTKTLKADVRTRHIPVILLTAKNNQENKIEGLRSHADAYITKPFSMDVLEETIHSLLENRTHLKDHFTTEIPREIAQPVGKKTEKAFLASLNSFIEANIGNEKLSIEDICKEMGMSKIQLYRKTKNVMDTSIMDYITNIRIQKAKHLLQKQDLSISEVAFKTGFASASYFSTVFKKATCETPKGYKEKYG